MNRGETGRYETTTTAGEAVRAFIPQSLKAGILREMTGGRRDRVFVYGRYLDVLNEGTEPLR